MKNIGKIWLEGSIPVIRVDGEWSSMDLTGGFAEVVCTTDKKIPEWAKDYCSFISRGFFKGKEKRIYIVRFLGTWGFNFVLNILNDRLRVFPSRFYRNLSPNARQLFRVIAGRPYDRGTFTLKELQELFGWKDDWGNLSNQISEIEKPWDELKAERNFFVIWSERRGKGEATEWTYERRKSWFILPKKMKLKLEKV
jgi:hypothetical protein